MLNKIYSYVLLCSALFLASCSSGPKNEEVAIIPMPVNMEMGSGTFKFDKTATIGISDDSLEPAANYLASIFKGAVTFDIKKGDTNADIVLTLLSNDDKEGSYGLDITSKQVKVAANSFSGIASAVASIHQLLPVGIEKPTADLVVTLPATSIKDAPRLGWRGLMMDSSRHFWTVDEVKGVLDLMAMYKLNRFHWHLTDDQGWRIEIKKYPLLTEKGAFRKFNSHDRSCINMAATQQNPDFNLPQDRIQVIDGDSIYGGYYTQDDIRDIVAYAGARGIDVVPEVDMPGHFLAAISQYPEVACDGLIGWGSTFSSPICPGKDSTIEFCKNVFAEVFELFPFEYAHLGGDEVEKDNWKKCADCQKRIKEEGLESEEALQAWFVREMEQFFLENNKRMIGWDEVVADGLSDKSVIMWWRGWEPKSIPTATAEGKNVVNTQNNYLYFDYDQDAKTLESLLGYDPVHADLSPEQQELVLGVQANCWAEWIPSIARLQYMFMPRMMALSTIGWCERPVIPTIDQFYKMMAPQFARLDLMEVNYRVPDITGFYDINVFTDKAMVTLNSVLPETEIRYTTDGTIPTRDSKRYEGPFEIDETTNFVFRTFRSNGTPSDTYKTKFIKSDYQEAVAAEVSNDGLKATWHNFRGNKCDAITSAPVNGEYQVDNVSIPEGVKGNIGLVFTGYINVPEDAVYTFALFSDDGSYLKINGEMVIDNDGPHSPKEISGQVALKKGLHPIEARYFDSNGGILEMYNVTKDGKKEVLTKEWFKN